jgi:ATP-dependent Clp protease adaptor protein ClpS
MSELVAIQFATVAHAAMTHAAITSATITGAVITNAVVASSATPTLEKDQQTVRKSYPNFKVIVLNDDFNTFQHVAQCLMKYIPNMTENQAWQFAEQIHNEGQAIVWVGPQEQAELYHMQLKRAGLTMAPLEEA